jgi:hypothetical protein
MATTTPLREATSVRAIGGVAPNEPDAPPGIPYRAMATLFRDALDQAQLITLPLLRALALDERIGADPHLRRAQRLLRQLQDELDAELHVVSTNGHLSTSQRV